MKFDVDAKIRFCAVLAQTGQWSFAAEAAGVSSSTARRAREEDAAFREAVDEAEERFRDALTAEIIRRGVHGWDEPRNFGQHGIQTVRRYSDMLLLAAAKRFDPAYRDQSKITVDATVKPGALPAVEDDPLAKLPPEQLRAIIAAAQLLEAPDGEPDVEPAGQPEGDSPPS